MPSRAGLLLVLLVLAAVLPVRAAEGAAPAEAVRLIRERLEREAPAAVVSLPAANGCALPDLEQAWRAAAPRAEPADRFIFWDVFPEVSGLLLQGWLVDADGRLLEAASAPCAGELPPAYAARRRFSATRDTSTVVEIHGLRGDPPVFFAGDTILLEFTARADCTIDVKYLAADGAAAELFPSAADQRSALLLKAEEYALFPRDYALALAASPPFGLDALQIEVTTAAGAAPDRRVVPLLILPLPRVGIR